MSPARSAFLCVLVLLVVACRPEPDAEGETPDFDEIKETVTRFYEEAFNDGGDLNAAYGLLSSETRATCSFSNFQSLTEATRSIVVGRGRLRVVSIQDLVISAGRVTLKVNLSGGDFTASFFPESATLRREDGTWRYFVTTDPTCTSLFAFFELDPGVEVTTSAQANPDCESAYIDFCIPLFPPDLDCDDIEEASFIAASPDPHGFDTDGDGFGCEENQPPDS